VTIKELRSLTGLTQAKFAEKYEIPRRTIEDWERDLHLPPEYVVKLLEYRITHELAEQ
jgi:putative transcriptional regulator